MSEFIPRNVWVKHDLPPIDEVVSKTTNISTTGFAPTSMLTRRKPTPSEIEEQRKLWEAEQLQEKVQLDAINTRYQEEIRRADELGLPTVSITRAAGRDMGNTYPKYCIGVYRGNTLREACEMHERVEKVDMFKYHESGKITCWGDLIF
mgnify:CR=1 FL=1